MDLALASRGEAFGGPTPRLAPVLSSSGFLNLDTVGICGQIILSCGAALYTVGCPAVSLAFTH